MVPLKYLLLVLTLTMVYYNQISGEETEEEKLNECRYLNSVRTNFTVCCHYPVFVVWRFDYDACWDVCSWDDFYCCVLVCLLNKLNVLTTNDAGESVLNTEGYIHSFMLSVGNDSMWQPVVESSTQNCVDQFGGSGGGYECKVVPKDFYEVVKCVYKENYIKCPPWNPHRIFECSETMKYTVKCMDNDYSVSYISYL